MLCEMELVESVEEWRQQMGLDKVVLLGHSMGGFIASAYAHRYPQHIQHLVLADPWGFPEKPAEEKQRAIPTWIRAIATIMSPFNPLAGLRVAGPWGPRLVGRMRPDLVRKFSSLHEEDIVIQYIYHCNAQNPSGETAFKNMTLPYGWAKFPMVSRMEDIPAQVPMTMIYGSRSWIDNSTGYEIKYIRKDSYVDVQVIKGAGHHIYADKAEEFNQAVNQICYKVDDWRGKFQQIGSTPERPAIQRINSKNAHPPISTLCLHFQSKTNSECSSNAGADADQVYQRKDNSELNDHDTEKYTADVHACSRKNCGNAAPNEFDKVL